MVDNGSGWNAPKLLRLIKAYYASTKMKVRAQCLLRSAPAFDKDVLSPLHSSITESTRFLARLCMITQGFRLEITSTCSASPMPKTS